MKQVQELESVSRYRKFAQKFIPQEKLQSIADFSWRVQNDIPPRELLGRYTSTPRQILDILWWNSVEDETEGGYILKLYDRFMLGDAPYVLEQYGFLPKCDRHEKAIVEEILYTTILKALAIGSLDIELPEERSPEQIDGISLLSVM